MKPISVLQLTAATFATAALLHAQVQSPSPAASAAPVAYEPLPTLKASVILQPQYFQGANFSVRESRPDLLRLEPLHDRLRLRGF
jgi:hypothetical protein